MSLEDELEKLKRGGVTLEPDTGVGPHHRRIIAISSIPNTRTGSVCRLECGHIVRTFGDLRHAMRDAKLMVFCEACANAE